MILCDRRPDSETCLLGAVLRAACVRTGNDEGLAAKQPPAPELHWCGWRAALATWRCSIFILLVLYINSFPHPTTPELLFCSGRGFSAAIAGYTRHGLGAVIPALYVQQLFEKQQSIDANTQSSRFAPRRLPPA